MFFYPFIKLNILNYVRKTVLNCLDVWSIINSFLNHCERSRVKLLNKNICSYMYDEIFATNFALKRDF